MIITSYYIVFGFRKENSNHNHFHCLADFHNIANKLCNRANGNNTKQLARANYLGSSPSRKEYPDTNSFNSS